MPRFVILLHETPAGCERPTHWDFMLEMGDVLRTWALEREPRAGVEIPAEALPNHRLAYLDYEGPVSGDRGEVRRWEAGDYEVTIETDDRLELRLRSGRFQCRATLTQDSAAPGRWRLELGE